MNKKSPTVSPRDLAEMRRCMKAAFMGQPLEPFVPDPSKPEEARFAGKTKYEVLCIRVCEAATAQKPDMKAVKFIQEHLFGKAMQRVQAKNVSVTYQSLLAQTAEREKRFFSRAHGDVSEDSTR